MAPVDINAVADRLSRERLTKYLQRTGGDVAGALDLYVWNHEIGAALNVPLQQFEVCLRNAVATALADAFGARWYTVNRLIGHNPDIGREVGKARTKAEEDRRGYPIGAPDVIAASTLGLWRELCKPQYAGLFWAKRVPLAFPHHPEISTKGRERAILEEVHRRVDLLLKLRNRIAHHEPIIGNTREAVGAKLGDRHSEMFDLMDWMDPNFSSWVRERDRFVDVLSACPMPARNAAGGP